jgi:hypothetical protein
MNAKRQFENQLFKLFQVRTHQLRSYLWPSRGKAPQLTKKRLSQGISRLQDIAVNDYLHSTYAKEVFKSYDYKRQWHAKRNKGFGVSYLQSISNK